MARRVTFKEGKVVDLGPVIPSDPSRTTPKNPKFTIIRHHKHKHLIAEWMKDNPTFTIKSSAGRPGGLAKSKEIERACARAARMLCVELGHSQKDASRMAATYYKKKYGWVGKERKNRKTGKMEPSSLEGITFNNLRRGRY